MASHLEPIDILCSGKDSSAERSDVDGQVHLSSPTSKKKKMMPPRIANDTTKTSTAAQVAKPVSKIHLTDYWVDEHVHEVVEHGRAADMVDKFKRPHHRDQCQSLYTPETTVFKALSRTTIRFYDDGRTEVVEAEIPHSYRDDRCEKYVVDHNCHGLSRYLMPTDETLRRVWERLEMIPRGCSKEVSDYLADFNQSLASSNVTRMRDLHAEGKRHYLGHGRVISAKPTVITVDPINTYASFGGYEIIAALSKYLEDAGAGGLHNAVNMTHFFNPKIVFLHEASDSSNATLLSRVLDLIGDNLGSFSQFILDIMNDIILAQIVLRQCADAYLYTSQTEEIIRKDAEATIADVMVALSRAVSHYQNIYLPRNGRFDRNEITILKNQVNNYFKGSQLNPAIDTFAEERERNIDVFRTAVVHTPCPSKDACDWEVISNPKQWIRVVEDRAAYLNDSIGYVAIMDSTQVTENEAGAVPVFASFARPSFVNTSHTMNVDEAVKQCHKNLAKELEQVFFDNDALMGDYDPKLERIDGLKGFLEVGHRVLNFTVEKSDGYLKIRADKGKKNAFDCPDDYPVRPLAVLYGVSDSGKKWYAGESRHFYPEPFETQAFFPGADGVDQLIDVFFHAIVFY